MQIEMLLVLPSVFFVVLTCLGLAWLVDRERRLVACLAVAALAHVAGVSALLATLVSRGRDQ